MSENKKMGRPSIFTKELGENICAQLAEGRTLRAICRDEGMPDMKSIFNWLQKDEEFFQHYTQAREVQAHVLADEVVELAESLGNACESEEAQAIRTRMDARKWYTGKVLPKIYGERTILEKPPEQPIDWDAFFSSGMKALGEKDKIQDGEAG